MPFPFIWIPLIRPSDVSLEPPWFPSQVRPSSLDPQHPGFHTSALKSLRCHFLVASLIPSLDSGPQTCAWGRVGCPSFLLIKYITELWGW